jgi:hypothetical protein
MLRWQEGAGTRAWAGDRPVCMHVLRVCRARGAALSPATCLLPSHAPLPSPPPAGPRGHWAAKRRAPRARARCAPRPRRRRRRRHVPRGRCPSRPPRRCGRRGPPWPRPRCGGRCGRRARPAPRGRRPARAPRPRHLAVRGQPELVRELAGPEGRLHGPRRHLRRRQVPPRRPLQGLGHRALQHRGRGARRAGR